MSSIDQQFVEFVVKSLVSNPDEVKIERRIDEKGVLLELTVDPEDLGRVIGKRGATAQSLRTLLRALGTKNDARYNLKIVDNGLDADRRSRHEHDYSENDSKTEQSHRAISEDTEVEAVLKEDKAQAEDDRYSKTRRELEDLDDLDI